ncbi:MAG TPA: hypothetical protein VF006_01090 [Longimicrobium sp.]
MSDTVGIQTAGDLEAVVLAESFDLLGSIVGPYMYRVSGTAGEQQAMFSSAEIQALFYIRVHEFLAPTTKVSSVASAPGEFSLFSGGAWLTTRYPDEAREAGLDAAYRGAAEWFDRLHRIVFWAPSVSRHLRLELPMRSIISMRANLEKHRLLRLDREIGRLQKKCAASGCPLTTAEAVAAREDYETHIRGMLEYHATEVAEHVGQYFLALYRLVLLRYQKHPTNKLDEMPYPHDVSNDVYRYMYTSAIWSLSGWTEARIKSSIPGTSPSFKYPYPQHEDWSVVEREQSAT